MTRPISPFNLNAQIQEEKKSEKKITAPLIVDEAENIVKKGEIKVPELPQDPDPCGNDRKPKLPKPPKKKPLDPRLERNKTKR